ncbi:MAG: FHA domain-containing protein [Acidobacteria bacterium]|nr:FHA domain-containing protein [Acidobacteriota bacterium]
MWLLRALDSSDDRPLAFRLMPGAVKTIGRAGAADFCVDAPLVSRLHCRISTAEDGQVEVVDLDSTNGTWINGEKISRAVLAEHQVLRVGRVEFVLERA